MEYRKKLTCFLQEYLLFPKKWYEEDGTLTPAGVRIALKMLLDEGVFDSPTDLMRQAFKDYGILLPNARFPEEKE